MEEDKVKPEEIFKEELAELRKQSEGTQELIKRWGTEMGDLRRGQDEIKQAADLLKGIEEKLAALGATKIPSNDGVDDPPAKADVDELESSLTDAQREAAQKAYEAADEAQKKAIMSDEEVRRQFLTAAKSADGEVPESPWKKIASGSAPESEVVDKIKELFNAEKARSKKVPGGPRDGAGGDFIPDEPVERRTVPVAGGGVLDAIKRSREATG